MAEITATEDAIEGRFKKAFTYPSGEEGEPVIRFRTYRPSFAEDDLFQLLSDKGVEVSAQPPPGPSSLERLLLGFGPTLLLLGLFLGVARRGAMGAGMGGFGRSRAQRYQPEDGHRVTFDDVAGIDDVEEEVAEIVDLLRHPERYRRLGATPPKGVLLSGPPGTGKTLLARALAGEADVPFYSASASEFIEMIVGVGASRVRDLFEQAKKDAPAIIFIDELDAIGRARGGATTVGGHDEREQTLDQILTEMDGFTGNEGVIVLGGNQPPRDPRPPPCCGRGGSTAPGDQPARPGRAARDPRRPRPQRAACRRCGPRHVAASTPGMVGADLKNLVNEAALLAVRRGRERVAAEDFGDALEKIVLGTARRIVMSPEDRRRTAYHEGGRALLGMLTPGADPGRKISIVPRGHALGATYQSPDEDRYGYSESYLRGRIAGALAGLAAEELVYGEVTTGSESDLEQVTRVARQMVGRWGMSPALGPVSVLPRGEQPLPGADGDQPAPATRELLDAEVRRLPDEGAEQARRTLADHRANLEALAQALLEAETLDADEAYRAAGIPAGPRRPASRFPETGRSHRSATHPFDPPTERTAGSSGGQAHERRGRKRVPRGGGRDLRGGRFRLPPLGVGPEPSETRRSGRVSACLPRGSRRRPMDPPMRSKPPVSGRGTPATSSG